MGAIEEREANSLSLLNFVLKEYLVGKLMKGVILAAGDGTRLASHTCQQPKILLKIYGKAIIDFTLDAFTQAGVTELAIVTGYRANTIEQWVGDGSRYNLRIRYLHNPNFERGNALSLYAARSFVGDELFLLSVADHMISPDILSRLLEVEDLNNTLAVDFAPSPRQMDDATKVLVSPEGMVTLIGKGLTQWNGVDAGVFLLTPAIFDTIAQLTKEDRTEYELSQAVTLLIKKGHPLRACDISGCFWQDIDTPEDLKLIIEMMQGGRSCKLRMIA